MGTIISRMKAKAQFIPDMVEFSDEDVANIERTWRIPLKTPLDAGETILLQFFEVYPHWQNKFEHFKHSPLLTLKGAPGFRTHAGRIVQMLDDTIQLLGKDDFDEEMKRLWQTHACNHYRRKIPIQAFIDLKGIILGILKEICNLTPAEYLSWEKFFCNVYHVVFSTMHSLAYQERK